jgi:holo-[acyl-carrier protein] synthase
MIVGIGNDILEISRMKRELERDGVGLKAEIFTPSEIFYCESKAYPERHFAARFAAKEALFKALGTGKINDMSWRDIEVIGDDAGKPHVTLTGTTQKAALRMNVGKIFVSLSHTEAWASANVVLESINGD